MKNNIKFEVIKSLFSVAMPLFDNATDVALRVMQNIILQLHEIAGAGALDERTMKRLSDIVYGLHMALDECSEYGVGAYSDMHRAFDATRDGIGLCNRLVKAVGAFICPTADVLSKCNELQKQLLIAKNITKMMCAAMREAGFDKLAEYANIDLVNNEPDNYTAQQDILLLPTPKTAVSVPKAEMSVAKPLVIMTAGHRPQHMFGFNMTDPRYADIKERLKDATLKVMDESGANQFRFINGMNLGVDQLFFEVAVEIKAERPNANIVLEAVVPCAEQDKIWHADAKAHYHELLAKVDRVTQLSNRTYFDGCINAAKKYMAEQANICVGYCIDGSGKGSTMAAIDILRNRHVSFLNVWDPKDHTIKKQLESEVYAVAAGRKTGIFSSWAECSASISGFKGQNYKKFDSKEAAEAWLKAQQQDDSVYQTVSASPSAAPQGQPEIDDFVSFADLASADALEKSSTKATQQQKAAKSGQKKVKPAPAMTVAEEQGLAIVDCLSAISDNIAANGYYKK